MPRTRDCCTYVCNTIVRESWYMCKNDVKSGLMDVTCDSADKGNWPYNRKLTPKIPSNYTKPSSTLYYFKLWTSLQCEEVSEVLTATLNCRTPAISLKITVSKQPIWLNWYIQYCLDLRKILGVAKKFLKSRSFLFQTPQNP